MAHAWHFAQHGTTKEKGRKQKFPALRVLLHVLHVLDGWRGYRFVYSGYHDIIEV